jgi:hypothetical protein
MANFNRYELESFAKRAAEAYLIGDKPLNDSICKIASDYSLNQDQIQRIVENSNTLVNGKLVKKARLEKSDPRVAFGRAETKEILANLKSNSSSAKSDELRKNAEFSEMFKVAEPTFDHDAVLNKTLGPMVEDYRGAQPVEVNPHDLAIDYVGGGELSKVASGLHHHSIKLACDRLEEVMIMAREKRAAAMHRAEIKSAELRDRISNQFHMGTSPATLRDVVKHACANPHIAQIADSMITKLAGASEFREGESVISDMTIVDINHPIVSGLRGLADDKNELDEARTVEEKVASAYRAARSDLSKAVMRDRRAS